jgi:hypothetical protein
MAALILSYTHTINNDEPIENVTVSGNHGPLAAIFKQIHKKKQ